MEPEKIIYLVHCVDTEGPLYESLSATSERLYKTFGLEFDLTPDLLLRLRRGEGLVDGMRLAVMDFLSENRMSYKTDWTKVDEMVDNMMSPEWRAKYPDDFGQGYAFSWFIIDHVGYETNPRWRALGYHAIYDHYAEKLKTYKPPIDRLYWHFHPMSFFHEAHKTSNNFSFTNHHIQVLNRRVIDKLDFPNAYRPGCHCERPDINLFLEMWIPFDFGNQGMAERPEDSAQKDICGGRFGDWRRATAEWEVYHPDFYDYQKKGNMRRYIARCLNLESRVRPITAEEIDKAFKRASQGLPTILSVTNHDEREMRPAIDWYYNSVREVQKGYPGVKIAYANAADAVRLSLNLPQTPPSELTFSWRENRLDIESSKPVWGPQPWFCFKTHDLRYIHENLDHQGERHWSFVFDDDSVRLDQIEAIGVAAVDSYGHTSVYRLSPDRDLKRTVYRYGNGLCSRKEPSRS